MVRTNSPRLSPGYERYRVQDPRIDAIWTFGAPEMPGDHVVPADGMIDIILDRRTDGTARATIFPATARSLRVATQPGDRSLGVRFRPGVAGPLLQNPENALRQLDAIGFDPFEESERLSAPASAILDDLGSPPALIEDLIASIDEGAARISDVFKKLGAHERTLQRLSRRWIGLSPKSFARIARTRAAKRALELGMPAADTALEFGFADQAHFTREFREMMGTTPVGFLQDRATRAR